MTASEYRAAGYNVSANVAQSVIDGAESVVQRAYIVPIIGWKSLPDYNETERRVLASLSYLYMLQTQSVFSTRAGAKVTSIESSETAQQEQVMQAAMSRARFELEDLARLYSLEPLSVVSDVCRIYFSSNFL